jgi:hypothetical protein
MRKTALASAFILALSFLAAVETQIVNLGSANPYSQARDSGVAAAPNGTEPPRISIFSPLTYITYDTSNISLTFKVWAGKSANASGKTSIYSVYYRADWLQSDIKVNSFDLFETKSIFERFEAIPEFETSLSLIGVPSGNHSITVYATETGTYYPDFLHYYHFYLTGSSTVSFVVNTTDNVENSSAEGEVPSDVLTSLPEITIKNPEDKSAYGTNDVALNLNVSFGDSTASARRIKEIYYTTDWQPNNTILYGYSGTEFSTTIKLTEIPDGNHTITVNATEARQYDGYTDYAHGLHYKVFEVTGSSSVSFTVDTKAPPIWVLSPENKTYTTSEVPLNFAVTESRLQITYSLDGQENVSVAGNTTLTHLTEGAHNVIAYTLDIAGNVGISEKIFFTVKLFPTTLLVVAVAAIAATGGASLAYFAKARETRRESGIISQLAERGFSKRRWLSQCQ